MKKILLLTDLTSGFSRNMLKGVVRYSEEHGPWIFYRMPMSYRELYGDMGVVRWAKRWKADAIVAQLSDIDTRTLMSLKIPFVIQNYRERKQNVSNLTGDYYNTGVMAANFFLQKGFRFFAYFGFSDTVWMRERGEGFKDTLRQRGFDVFQFNKTLEDKANWTFDVEEISLWLLELPKPVAIFACDDYHALQISEVCNLYNISIPDEISLLGVDNDELFCNISNPPLSSIELDIQQGGYELGKLLHDFIEKKREPPVDVVIKPIRIVSRGSTEIFAVGDKNVEKVLKYIEQNYMDPLSVTKLVEITNCSRRVLEKVFKKETGHSVYQYIQLFRVNKFAELLVTTQLSLIDAAYMVGFDDYKNLSRIFKKYKQLTPLQYRRKFSSR